MQYPSKKIMPLIVSILFISSLAGCRVRRFPLPVPPPIVPRVSPYAKVPARAAHHRYHYFPAHQVYFDNSRNIYFYFSKNAWFSAPVLPPHIHINRDQYVIMELEGSKPHLHHKQTVKRYPPGALRKERPAHNKKPHKGRSNEREEYREKDKKRDDTYRDPKQRRRDEKIDPRQEYRAEDEEHRDENNKYRRKYRDEDEERRDENNKYRRKYRDEDEERRDENNTYRRKYRDEDEEERDDNDTQRQHNRENWRESDQVWR